MKKLIVLIVFLMLIFTSCDIIADKIGIKGSEDQRERRSRRFGTCHRRTRTPKEGSQGLGGLGHRPSSFDHFRRRHLFDQARMVPSEASVRCLDFPRILQIILTNRSPQGPLCGENFAIYSHTTLAFCTKMCYTIKAIS